MKRFMTRDKEARRARLRLTLQFVISNLSFSLLYYKMMNLGKRDHDPS